MLDAGKVALFVPPNLGGRKLALFEQIGASIERAGGRVVRRHFAELAQLDGDTAPIIGCTVELHDLVQSWIRHGRRFIYWDRGYARRGVGALLPLGSDGGYYRWHVNAFQMPSVRDVPADRWQALATPLAPWRKGGRHVLVAAPSPSYQAFHGIEGWTEATVSMISVRTDRPVVIRAKDSKRSLLEDLQNAHCMVTHGSNAAVEAAIMGCPVFVDASSAAAHVGRTDLAVENPIYPDREKWAHALAYSQFSEREMVDGTLWRLIQ